MSASRPEAESEYSRGHGASEGRERPQQSAARLVSVAVFSVALAGAILLIVAEFTPLLDVHSAARLAPIATVNTGSHDSYALIPIGLLAALLAVVVWRSRNRLALLATGLLGLAALLIALINDLPDAQATGVVVHPFVLANATPSTGFYLESLGAVLLILSAAGGLLLLAPPPPRRSRPLRPAASAGE